MRRWKPDDDRGAVAGAIRADDSWGNRGAVGARRLRNAEIFSKSRWRRRLSSIDLARECAEAGPGGKHGHKTAFAIPYPRPSSNRRASTTEARGIWLRWQISIRTDERNDHALTSSPLPDGTWLSSHACHATDPAETTRRVVHRSMPKRCPSISLGPCAAAAAFRQDLAISAPAKPASMPDRRRQQATSIWLHFEDGLVSLAGKDRAPRALITPPAEIAQPRHGKALSRQYAVCIISRNSTSGGTQHQTEQAAPVRGP